MNHFLQKIGFTYFNSQNFYLIKELNQWLSALKKLGASSVIFNSDFSKAISEDVFIKVLELDLQPIIHFNTPLPSARSLNQVSVLLDVYAKWGVSQIIIGDKPNKKASWPTTTWHDENLVDHYLDRFLPLANYLVQIGVKPVMAPLQPGGDFWDLTFLDLALAGLQNRKMGQILDQMGLSCYGYLNGRTLSWGSGGPEKWLDVKPYLTPNGQEDQIAFRNFEWVQSVSFERTGRKIPITILDAGNNHQAKNVKNYPTQNLEKLNQMIDQLIDLDESVSSKTIQDPLYDPSINACTFDLNTIANMLESKFEPERLIKMFNKHNNKIISEKQVESSPKLFAHYLLLPAHVSGISDVVLNKVRPVIKKYQPTVGFSVFEASFASKVSVFPDPLLFPPEEINALRTAGCLVEILPESGIDIATSISDS